MNIQRTNIIPAEELNHFKLGIEAIEVIKDFVCFGSIIHPNGDCMMSKENRLGWPAMKELEKILMCHHQKWAQAGLTVFAGLSFGQRGIFNGAQPHLL